MNRLNNVYTYEDWCKINESIKYIDSVLINEELDFGKIKDKIIEILNKISSLPEKVKKKLIFYTIISMLAYSPMQEIIKAIDSVQAQFGQNDFSEAFYEKFDMKDPTEMRVSQKGWDFVKSEETLKLKAYDIGDGKITVGWGHAEDLRTSKFNVGDPISKEEAQRFIQEDMKVAADGVRKIFEKWKKKGIDRRLTQDMFDALVSMAFNMGVGGFRNSETIQYIKRGDYEGAGSQILRESEKLYKRFPGLKTRRQNEHDLFMSYKAFEKY